MATGENISERFVIKDLKGQELFWFGILKMRIRVIVNAFECSFDIKPAEHPEINSLIDELLLYDDDETADTHRTADKLGKKLLIEYRKMKHNDKS